MNLPTISTTQIALLAALAVVLLAAIAAFAYRRKRRTEKLRAHFGGDEYALAVETTGNRAKAEAALEQRTKRVEGLHVKALSAGDRTRFTESWRSVQARFVDGPAEAVIEADRLLGEVMSTRGYPVSDFEQRAADISVAHPHVLKNYRTAHEIAVRQTQGKANTEDLRQAMVHYRSLFEELAGEPELTLTKAAQ